MTKDEYIEEIKRITLENGGVPPGKERFYEITGTKESEWIAKYWVKWSDAIAEAGFTPNSMNCAYEHEFIVSSLAKIVKEMGKWPSTTEVKFYIRNHPGMPSHNVYGVLGNRRQQAEAVRDYLTTTGDKDLANSLDLNAIAVRMDKDSEGKSGGGERGLVSGSVYLFKSGDEYKIGLATDLGRRQGQLKTLTAKPMLLIHEIKSDDIYGIEKYWHGRFDQLRCNGEWFKLSLEHIKAFKKRKFM